MVTIRFALKGDAINRDGGIAADTQIECDGGISFMNVDRGMRIESIQQECGDDIDDGLNKYPRCRHCEKRRDEAIQLLAFWIAPLRSQ